MKDIIGKIKSRAKQLTIGISQLGEGTTKEQLHGDALELLLNIHELETLYNQVGMTPQANTRTQTEREPPAIETQSDKIRNEINKIHRKLPIWARRQHQINSKILTLYLKLEKEGISNITEKMLMERYNNQQEFYRNFPQMKTISDKNHGKVFEVENGIVKIWEPIRDIVEEYKNAIFQS